MTIVFIYLINKFWMFWVVVEIWIWLALRFEWWCLLAELQWFGDGGLTDCGNIYNDSTIERAIVRAASALDQAFMVSFWYPCLFKLRVFDSLPYWW